MQRNVCFWHCDGSMRCQCETVSTLARICNYIRCAGAHLCPDTRLNSRTALTRFSCASWSPPSPCSGLEIVCTAAPRCPVSFCPSSPSPFAEVSVSSNARPFHCLSCRSLWMGSDFVPRSARFSADVHALTMTIPRFTNCCGQRTFVDKWRFVPTPSRLQIPRAATLSRSSVRTSNPTNKKQQEFSDQHLLHW